jgi:hypothetical protein
MLKGSPGDAKRMMKTTKLTPRSRSAVMISSLDNTRAVGRNAESFMVDAYLPSTKIESPTSILCHGGVGRCEKKWTVTQVEISPKF